jgi:hypothetical protein
MGRCSTIDLAAAFFTACLLAGCGSNSGASSNDSGADTGAQDTGAPDLGAPDLGVRDTGTLETGPPDAGTSDTGVADTAPLDAGVGDGGSSETDTEAGPNPDCAANNDGGGCTPTEALFEAHSPDCYNCLVNAGCLNDTVMPLDSMHECEDVPGAAAKGAKSGQLRSSLCLETIQCILQTKCASMDTAVCYCGSLGAGNACIAGTVPSSADGSCLQAELDGLEHVSTDTPMTVIGDFYNGLLGGGKANQIFNCAAGNGGCPACLQ